MPYRELKPREGKVKTFNLNPEDTQNPVFQNARRRHGLKVTNPLITLSSSKKQNPGGEL